MTTFVVLTGVDDSLSVADGKVEAHSAEQAIRKVAETRGPGRYIAVPARSWRVRDVKVEATVKVSFGSGS